MVVEQVYFVGERNLRDGKCMMKYCAEFFPEEIVISERVMGCCEDSRWYSASHEELPKLRARACELLKKRHP